MRGGGSLRTRLKAFAHDEVGEMADGDEFAVPGVALDPHGGGRIRRRVQ